MSSARARSCEATVLVLDWSRTSGGVDDDVDVKESARAAARARDGDDFGVVIFTRQRVGERFRGDRARVRKMLMTIETRVDDEQAMERAFVAADDCDSSEIMDVATAMKVATLALKARRDASARTIVLVVRGGVDVTESEAKAILTMTTRVGAKCHVIRLASTNATMGEVKIMQLLCRCCAPESGECLRASLGECHECGAAIGFDAMPRCDENRLARAGLVRERTDGDMDAHDDERARSHDDERARSMPSPTLPLLLPGCRDAHAEFAHVAEHELSAMEKTCATQVGVDVRLKTIERVEDGDESARAPSVYKSVVKNERVFFSIDDLASVSRALDEPIASVRCGILLQCFGANARRLNGLATLKVDTAHRYTGTKLELWLRMDDTLELLLTHAKPTREEIMLQRISFPRAEAFRRAASGGEEDVRNALALGLIQIKYPLPNDSSRRAFILQLGVGRGKQEKFFWLTRSNVRDAAEHLERLRHFLAEPPTLELHTGLPKSTLRSMYLAYSALAQHSQERDASMPAMPPAPELAAPTKPIAIKRNDSREKKRRDIEWLESMKAQHLREKENVASVASTSASVPFPPPPATPTPKTPTPTPTSMTSTQSRIDDSAPTPTRDASPASDDRPSPPPNTKVNLKNLNSLFR